MGKPLPLPFDFYMNERGAGSREGKEQGGKGRGERKGGGEGCP